jgi:hypothetical protein
VTGTLDAARLDRGFTAFAIAEVQAAANMPYRTTLDQRGRLHKRARRAGRFRWPDTSQTCSPQGRLAIAADLPI